MTARICTMVDCGKPELARGLCGKHWRDWRKQTVLPTREERFWAKVNKTEACWEWTASLHPSGYGQFMYVGHRPRAAHRVAYEWLRGPIPEGLVLDHLCRNRTCVNPDHLEPVTHRENILRGVGASARNVVKTRCDQGHPFDKANTYIDQRGRRTCRTCRREGLRRFYAKRKAS